MINDEYAIIQMIKNGTLGFLLKASKLEELESALNDVRDGKYFCSSTINNFSKIIKKEIANITKREKELLHLYSQGFDNKKISTIMNLSIRTVEGFRNSLFDKFDIHSKSELVIFALRSGIIHMPTLPHLLKVRN
jgi:DNA-binding NarL/FixJ family response regulator